MSRRKFTIICAALAVILIAYLLLACLPIMECIDGCSCGYQRKWYVMPDSLWHGKRWFMYTTAPGDPSHHHLFWDSQWGVWFDMPWKK